MVHIIGWQHGDSTHLKVIYNELFIWPKTSSIGGGNSLSTLAVAALSIAREGVLGLEDPNSPWHLWPSESWSVGLGERQGRASKLQEPSYLIYFWTIPLGVQKCLSLSLLTGDHGSLFTSLPPSPLPFLPPSSLFLVSVYRDLLSRY